MNPTSKNSKLLSPQAGSHFVCHSRCKMRYLAEIVTVESFLPAADEPPEHAKNQLVLKAKIAQPSSQTEEQWPKYDALIVPRQEKKDRSSLECLTAEMGPEVLISLDRQNPTAVDTMCDLIDIMRNWESSSDQALRHVLRWGSTCERHEIEKNQSAHAWLLQTCSKYLMPSACVDTCTKALRYGSSLLSKPLRTMIASDGIFVHFVISGIGKEAAMHPKLLKKVVSQLSGHAVLIMKRGEEVHLCVIETLAHIDSKTRHPLCILICDLSKRVFSKMKITSKVG